VHEPSQLLIIITSSIITKNTTPNTTSQREGSPVIKVSGLGPEPNPFACLLMGP
jgi:hypothetical protein